MSSRVALREAFTKYAGVEFGWGTFDCCLFTSAVVREVHGVDYSEFFPEYTNKKQAIAILRKYGSLEGLVNHLFGSMVPIENLVNGDVAIVKRPTWSVVGPVCEGNVILKALYGVHSVPLSVCSGGWNTCPR